MDYSLVVGVDSVKNELVVGIVGTYRHLFIGYLSYSSKITFGLTLGTRS